MFTMNTIKWARTISYENVPSYKISVLLTIHRATISTFKIKLFSKLVTVPQVSAYSAGNAVLILTSAFMYIV
jgi:hypothetical protein